MSELWAIVTVVSAAITGITVFVLTLYQIRHLRFQTRQLEMSIEKLARELAESRRALYEPTLEEIKLYGRKMAEEYHHVLREMADDHREYLRLSFDRFRHEVTDQASDVEQRRTLMELLHLIREQLSATQQLRLTITKLSEGTVSVGSAQAVREENG